MKIYVATSWRNEYCTAVIEALQADGHEVYDFREQSFDWAEVSIKKEEVTALELLSALIQPVARAGFERDMMALRKCDAVVLVLPSGKSAHLEAGFAAGKGKKLIVYSPVPLKPELMYLMGTGLVSELTRVRQILKSGK